MSDGDWYRGFIESIVDGQNSESDDSKFVVRSIDYGFIEEVPKMNLKFLDKNHTVQSAFATKIYLPHAKANADTNDDEIKIILHEMLKEIIIEVDIKAYLSDCLIGEVINEGVSLTDVLVDKKSIRRLNDDEIEIMALQESEKRILHYTEFNFEYKEAPEIVNPVVAVTPKFEGINAYVTHLIDPESLHLNLEADGDSITKMQDNIQIIAESLEELKKFSVGTLCIAKYETDGVWYRAKILDHGDSVTSILYIDFGNSDCITNNELLRVMPEAFAKFEPYGIHCSLAVHPAEGNEWTDVANAIVYDTFDKVVMFEFISKKGKKKYINLYCDGKDIGKTLITNGLAKPYEVVKTGEKCFISHSVSLSEFYIQLDSSTANLELMEDYLKDYEKFPIIENPTEGLVVSARFHEDQCWYRAKVMYHNDKASMVSFIDYGNQALVTEMRQLPDDIRDLPILSKKCSLFIPKEISHWSEQAEAKFLELAQSGQTIFDVEMEAPTVESIIVHLSVEGNDILEDLVSLCQIRKQPNIIDMSMTESVIERFLAPESEKVIESSNDSTDTQKENVENNSEQISKIFDGYICYSNSPSDFYIHFDCDIDKINECEDYLKSECANLVPVTTIKDGVVYVAECEEDEKLYRVHVLEHTSDEKYEVFYMDWGNKSYTKKVFEAPANPMLESPFWAKHCTLFVEDMKNDWNAESSTEFAEVTANFHSFQFQIVNRLTEPMQIIIHDGEKNINDHIVSILKSTTLKFRLETNPPSRQPSTSTLGTENSDTQNNNNVELNKIVNFFNIDKIEYINQKLQSNMDDIMKEVNEMGNQIASDVDDVFTNIRVDLPKSPNEIFNGVPSTPPSPIDSLNNYQRIRKVSIETSQRIVDGIIDNVNDEIEKISNEISGVIIEDILTNVNNQSMSHPSTDSFEMRTDVCNNSDDSPKLGLYEQRKLNQQIMSSIEDLQIENKCSSQQAMHLAPGSELPK